jgi:hypothetical protein
MAKANLKIVPPNFHAEEGQQEPPGEEMQDLWSELLDSALKARPLPKTYVPTTEREESPTMSTPSREEFDAKLREMASQMETRALRTDNKIDEMLRKLETRDAVHDERLRAVSDKLQALAGDVTATRDSVGSLKTTIITTTIATGLAVTALIYTLNTSLFTAFESGKTTASALSDASNKLTQVTERLDAMSKQPPAPAAPAAGTAPSPSKK